MSRFRPKTSSRTATRTPSRPFVWLSLALSLELLAGAAKPPSGAETCSARALVHAARTSTGERTLRPDLQAHEAQPALAEGQGISPWHLLLTELRSQRPRPFDQFASPRAQRRGFCLVHDEPRPAPWRGPPNTGLPEAGRVAHRSQGPPGPC